MRPEKNEGFNNCKSTFIVTPGECSIAPLSFDSKLPPFKRGEVSLFSGKRFHKMSWEVIYLSPFTSPVKGKLILTNYKLFFSSGDDLVSVEVPFGVINRLVKMGGVSSRRKNSYGIKIFCKDIRSIKFAFYPENHSRREFFKDLQQYAFPIAKNCLPFAFLYNEQFVENVEETNGWNIYDPVQELNRLGIPNESWKITHINKNHELCDSYPAVLTIPVNAEEELIRSVATFRSRSRIPILSWLHPFTQASITRSSQPMVGIRSKAKGSKEDRRYLKMILDANIHSDKLCIMDARPLINAVANKATGGGYESGKVYLNTELIFLDIQNIHVMRSSLEKLKNICFPKIDDRKWVSKVEETKWLEHLKCVIAGAVRIVDKVENEKKSVLVHCSDGWDRTSQLTSLSMLLMDPYYRTLKGFQVLIEKEWLSVGHKFQDRIGHGNDRYSDKDRSPIFQQWVDAVYQVTQQFPRAFEFNEHFLVTILDQLYSCQFGTFLYNSERERVQNELKNKTVSLWSSINSQRDLYISPCYHTEPGTNGVLFPGPSIRQLTIWTEYYCRWNARVKSQEPKRDKLI